MKTNPNHNVYPAAFDPNTVQSDTPKQGFSEEFLHALTTGITKREYFAAMAMSGLCANPDFTQKSWKEMSVMATDSADAIIEELNKEKETVA